MGVVILQFEGKVTSLWHQCILFSLKSKTKLDYEGEWDEPIQPHNVKYNGNTRLSLLCRELLY